MYGYKCEYCNGTVRPRLVKREVFKHKKGFVILENVVIRVCDGCGDRYYSAERSIVHCANLVWSSASSCVQPPGFLHAS
jgi:YgiT-type zinc finger domain-containing protein